MGCCASKTGKAPSASNNYRHSSSVRSDTSLHIKSSRAQPPPSFEEETVKEVLSESETPTLKPAFPNTEEEEKKNIAKISLQEIQEQDDDNVDKKSLMITTEEISEVSEICSLSESVSTTTVTEKRKDDDGEVRQRVKRSPARSRNRSLSGDFSANRERTVGKSPARRSEPSPGRVRSVPCRERRGSLTGGQSRDPGDSSGLRSRSPATRTVSGEERPVLGRSPSARRSGKPPGRARSDLPDRVRKVAETNREGKCPPATNELLENPHVSLECFIFL